MPDLLAGLASAWGLTDDEREALRVSAEPKDAASRVVDFLRIHDDLHRLFDDPVLADRWMMTPSRDPEFAGGRPFDLIVSRDVDGVEAVRRFLDRWLAAEHR